MMSYKFSNNLFYPYALESDYKTAGSWPEDGMDVNEDIYDEFSGIAPEGMLCGTDSDGYPCWVVAPPRSHEELIIDAKEKRSELLAYADAVTADWRIELMLGDISDQDKETLSAWMDYKKKVKAVDTSTAPYIVWPTPPGAQAS